MLAVVLDGPMDACPLPLSLCVVPGPGRKTPGVWAVSSLQFVSGKLCRREGPRVPLDCQTCLVTSLLFLFQYMHSGNLGASGH